MSTERVSRAPAAWIAVLARRSPVDAEPALRVVTALLVGGSVLAIGGVHPPVVLVLGALSAVGVCLALWIRRQRADGALWRSPALVFLGLALVTLLQLVPLPMGWLQAIAPVNADIWARALLPLGIEAPTSAPISLDPGASWIEVVRWTTYAAVFLSARALATRDGAQWGVTLVFVCALIAAFTTLGHGLTGATRVFGLYEPAFKPQPWHVGPLLNPNNLSGYLNLGAMCGLGLLLMRDPPAPRWLVGLGVATLLGVNATTASRGGLVILLVGVALLALTLELTRRRRALSVERVQRARGVMLAAIVFGVLLALLGGTPEAWRELYDKNLEKLDMLLWVRPLIEDFTWLGVGRGAFESVYPAYQPAQGAVVFTHAENFVGHWVAEWGAPVTGLALLALAVQLRPGRIGVGRSAMIAGAWFGALVLVVQNLFDLGLEVPGVMIALVVVLGSLWGDHRRLQATPSRRLRHGARRAVRRGAAWVLVTAALVAAGARNGWTDVASDRLRLHTAMERATPPRTADDKAAIRADLRNAMARHPAEPYFPLMGAVLAYQERDDNPIPWLQRTLERSRVNGKAHLLLARVLFDHRAIDQALLELRLAVESDPGLVVDASKLAAVWLRDERDINRVVPPEGAATVLDALGRRLTDAGRRELGARCDELALSHDASLVGPHERLANDLVAQTGRDAGCDAACQAALETHIAALDAAHPRQSTAARLRARWLLAQGDPAAAEALLASTCERATDRDTCLRARAEAAAKVDDPTALATASKMLLSVVCMHAERCAATATWLGDLHQGRGEMGAAVAQYQRAVSDSPSVERYKKLGNAASRAGLHTQAAHAFETALRMLGGSDPALERRLQQEKGRAFDGSLGP